MQDILVVVDMQNDFIDGELGSPDAQWIVSFVEDKIVNFEGRVFFTRDTHDENYADTLEGKWYPEHCIRDTYGQEVHSELLFLDDAVEIFAVDKNTFGSLELCELLKRVDADDPIRSITVVGLCTDICVIANALLLRTYFPNVEMIVDAQCCAGSTPEKHYEALHVMESCCIKVINDEQRDETERKKNSTDSVWKYDDFR